VVNTYQPKTLPQLLEENGGQLSIVASLAQFEIARRKNCNLHLGIRKSQSLRIAGLGGPMVFIAAKSEDGLDMIKAAIGENHFVFQDGRLVEAKLAAA
jgi:hypothetical protein